MKRPHLTFFLTFAISITALAATPLQITMSINKITSEGQVVQFDLANPGQEAALTHVFNLQGEEVAQLSASSLNHFFWDGKDVDEQPVEAGMYVVQIRHGGEVWHGPVLVNR
jgi:hypothetical protein